MDPPGNGYCIACGERLERGHRFCWSCGAPRWAPPPSSAPPQDPPRPPPAPGVQPYAAARAQPKSDFGLRALPWLYAAGAVLWLLSLAQSAATLASSHGRDQISQQLASAGYGTHVTPLVVGLYGTGTVLFAAVAAATHAVAYYGLRARKRWGWLAAVLLAGLWSLLIVGIPLLFLLLRPATRRAYGID